MTLRVIRPTSVTEAMLTYSTVAEDTNPAWSAGETCAADVLRHLASTHRVYASAAAGNTGHDPATSPTWWVDAGATNKWAMFDGALGRATTSATDITVRLQPGAVSGLALMNVQARKVRIVIRSTPGGTVVYDELFSLSALTIGNWLEYFTAPFNYRTEYANTNLPLYSQGEIEVTLYGNGQQDVVCAEMVLGTSIELGVPTYGAKLGITDYSKKDTDAWGNTTLVQRSFARTLDLGFKLDGVQLDRVYAALSELRSTPCVWLADGLPAIYGWMGDFSIDVRAKSHSYCSLQIKGLT
jgi:hypothetical protein